MPTGPGTAFWEVLLILEFQSSFVSIATQAFLVGGLNALDTWLPLLHPDAGFRGKGYGYGLLLQLVQS